MTAEKSIPICYHCHAVCEAEIIKYDDKIFCCDGCKVVFDILQENQLCNYYKIPDAQGNSPEQSFYQGKNAYLDLPQIRPKILEYTENGQTQVSWYIPQMHCSSCIWLLENLGRIHPGVVASTVNFPEKKVRIVINDRDIELSALADLLTSIGYEPYISLQDVEGKALRKINRLQLYKIGIAGFAFGNIMLMSFPDYFSLGQLGVEKGLKSLFGTLSLILSLPVFFFSAADFFVSAAKALRRRQLNIDTPIAMAILLTFVRSVVEIATDSGTGYLDSMTGIVFFMLLGRYFQDKTHTAIAFDRNYKSYFPVAVSVLKNQIESKTPVSDLLPGDFIRIHNQELIPCDTRLISESATIDYSFVSGEAVPVQKFRNETIFAGGRALGPAIEMEVTKKVSQSYLTQLWNNQAFSDAGEEKKDQHTEIINRYFTLSVGLIGLISCLFWIINHDIKRGFDAMTTVWIVACPCALLLSENFTKGNLLGIFGRHKFYLKNASVFASFADINTIVFDKTGTLTLPNVAQVDFIGKTLSREELRIALLVTSQSAHPLSRFIKSSIYKWQGSDGDFPWTVSDFKEIPGLGMEAEVSGHHVKMGSAKWIAEKKAGAKANSSQVYFAIDGITKGYFEVHSQYRAHLDTTVKQLKELHYEVFLLSGDQPTDTDYLTQVFGNHLNFGQTPEEKLNFIENLRKSGKRVMMIGDGLNDAGALAASDAGIAISDDVNNFSPACDGILKGDHLSKLPAYIKLAKTAKKIIIASFTLSVAYNVMGLYFATQGLLSPVVAAILMPASSISIILFTTLASNWKAYKLIG